MSGPDRGRETVPVHIHTGGAKEWTWATRRYRCRKLTHIRARDGVRARLRLFDAMAVDPGIVEGYVGFSQTYYDWQPTLIVRVTKGYHD